ncbi:MAG: urea carboxylase-associated family protein [Defluviicoccus sp.]|nr:urea carboxylase-associated family protein [Defluviicoccus sp.]MDE0386185.1 urea carboxylase-associated family protein [Defluviicoccus sp.]
MKLTSESILEAATGLALELPAGQRLRVVDLDGLQVVDMALFNAENPREKLSTSYSRSRAGYAAARAAAARSEAAEEQLERFHPRDSLTVGDRLMSTINREMMLITADTPEVKGMHDVHGRMCNRALFEMLGLGPKDGCHEIIGAAVAPYGLLPEDIPDTMDLFMNYHHDCASRRWVLEEGCSRPGDYIEFEALMDCLVGLSNCPCYRGGRIGVEIHR